MEGSQLAGDQNSGGVTEKGLLEFVLGVRRTWYKTFQPGGKALKVGDTASSGRRLEKIAKSKRSR